MSELLEVLLGLVLGCIVSIPMMWLIWLAFEKFMPIEPYVPMTRYPSFDADGYPLAFGKRLYSGEQGRLDPKVWAVVNQACDELQDRDTERTQQRINEILER